MQGVLKVMKLFKLTIMLSVLMSIVEVKAQVNSPISSKTEEPVLDYNDMNGDGNINASDSLLSYVSWLLGIGIDNIEMSNNPKIMPILSDFFSGSTMEVNGSGEYKENLKSCISIIDDDVIDNQIPSSSGRSTVQYNRGGYFSVLLPMMLSLGNKYGKNLCPGLACEGQRVGFTHYMSADDSYTTLNENGRCVKWIHDNMGWNVFNHSMTAQIPTPTNRTFYVDGIDSELAQQIINENNEFYAPYSFFNCKVLDRLTGRWYELNTNSRNAWVERIPTKKYALPFYQDYITKKWYFNRDFDFEYSWGEWVKRADELGLPNEKVIVHNGGTGHIYTALAGRKYANWSVRTTGIYNYPPIAATVNRIADVDSSNDNVRNVNYENTLKGYIDTTFNNKSWMVFMSHFNESPNHNNYYMTGVTYPDGDPNYPSDWIIPLNYSEIQDIIGENVHDYINHPPSRLNISTWDEWHPAPGTKIKSLYDVLDYALSKGVEFVSPMEGWNTHGNILNLGVEKRNQNFSYDGAANQTPYTDEEKSYLTIGADMSIRCSYSPVSFTELSSPEITINVATAPIIYNGFAQTPDITVKDGEIILVNGIHYTVSYSNNINVGTAIVTITGKGHYTGTKTVTFTIDVPPIISFVDTKVKAVCVANWDTDHDGELSGAEAIAVTNLGEIFTGNTNVTSFNELQCFTGINNIGKEAFMDCTGLTSITIPYNVTSIGESAFSGCSGLSSIIIPNSVTSIENDAFESCDLKECYCYAENVPTMNGNSFNNATTVYVPVIALSQYKTADSWKEVTKLFSIEKYKLTYIVDGEEFKINEPHAGMPIEPIEIPTKEGYTFSGWSEIPETMPAKDVTVTGTFAINKYKLKYIVDGVEYKTQEIEYGTKITPEAAPTKEGYTFSGWSEIPETMPAKDVTVTGTFAINKYKLKYIVDGVEYKTQEIEYGTKITPEAAPTKEGYTFSGWSEIPETMPAKDVTVTGTFAINKYKLKYIVDGVEYKTQEIEYGTKITPEAAPTKEGYTFSGWSEIPETMPAKDVTVTGTFAINKYKLKYIVDGVEYKTQEIEYGTKITPEAAPTKEGYTFSGWSEIPETMPAKGVTVTGSFTVNKYKLIYKVDGADYKSYDVEYGASITPEAAPVKEGYSFSGWSDIPNKMPAKNVIVTGNFKETTGIIPVINDSPGALIYDMQGRRIDHLQKGLNIIRMSDGKTKKVMGK